MQLLKRTNEIEKQILELWADSEIKEDIQQHGVEDNVISCSTSYLDGCRLDGRKWVPRVNSEIRESKVDNLRRKGKDIIPNRTFSSTRMIRHRTFPSKMSQQTVVEVIKRQKKKRKKADAKASMQAPTLR